MGPGPRHVKAIRTPYEINMRKRDFTLPYDFHTSGPGPLLGALRRGLGTMSAFGAAPEVSDKGAMKGSFPIFFPSVVCHPWHEAPFS